jgi:hypothetical protein
MLGPAAPSPKFDASTAQTYPPTARFYDLGTLRTLFLDFENADWSDEIVAFNDTDVEVPATLRVDGQTLTATWASERAVAVVLHDVPKIASSR